MSDFGKAKLAPNGGTCAPADPYTYTFLSSATCKTVTSSLIPDGMDNLCASADGVLALWKTTDVDVAAGPRTTELNDIATIAVDATLFGRQVSMLDYTLAVTAGELHCSQWRLQAIHPIFLSPRRVFSYVHCR
jgi:hypothetical protein